MNAEAVVRKALDLWNEGNLDGYLTLFDPDLEWEMPAARGRGLKGIPEALAAQLTALPDYHFDVRQIITSGEMAAVETSAVGHNTGPIRLPGRPELPPTGKRVFRTMVLVMRVRDERICEFREYSNHPSWAVQLMHSGSSS